MFYIKQNKLLFLFLFFIKNKKLCLLVHFLLWYSHWNRMRSKSFGLKALTCFSVQFSRSVVSNSLWPDESQHARPPCPSPSPGVHSISRPSSRWCHLILCRPLLLRPPIPPSIRVSSKESTLCMRWPKYWSFSFSIILLQIGSPCFWCNNLSPSWNS